MEKKYCRECGSEINEKAVVCPKCGVATRESTDLSPGLLAAIEILAGLFGFLGVGHMASGNFRRGIILLLGYWVFGAIEVAVLLLGTIFTLGIGLIVLVPLAVIIWVGVPVASGYSLYKAAEKQYPG